MIDPSLAYSTYLGGSATDNAQAITVDPDGDAYVVGYTNSTDFPVTQGVAQATNHGGANDVIVSKLNADASALVYSTYLGGTGNDRGVAIRVDAAGDAYVAGQTNSSNFPTTPGAFQTALLASQTGFVSKLNPDGSELVYSTLLGGSATDALQAIAIDAAGDAYVTGITASSNFPVTMGAYQTSLASANDVFVSKLNPDGTALLYSTFLGGDADETGYGIAVNAAGDAYVGGVTASNDFPVTPGAYDTTYPGGSQSGFVTKLNADGSDLVYSTYLGGTGPEQLYGLAIDPAGDAYVAGQTSSSNFPTTMGAFQPVGGGGGVDAFVTKFNPDGTGLAYSTFLGGGGADYGRAIVVDAAGNAYVAGFTASSNFPVTADVPQDTYTGTQDAFVSKLNPDGAQLVFSTYLGGSASDGISVNGIAVGVAGDAYVAGATNSSDFPVFPLSRRAHRARGHRRVRDVRDAAVLQPTSGGGQDGFVAKFATHPVPDIVLRKTAAAQVAPGGVVTYTITVDNQGVFTVRNVDVSDDLSGVLDQADYQGDAHVTGPGSVTFDPGMRVLSWSGTLSAGQHATITYSVKVHDGLTGGALSNGVSGPVGASCGSGGDPNPPCVIETRIVPPPPPPAPASPAPDVRLTKTASPTTVHPGGQVAYTLTALNHGPGQAAGVIVEDPAPSGVILEQATPSQGNCTISAAVVRCSLGSLPDGGQAQVLVTATIAADASGQLTNEAIVWDSRRDPTEPNNAASTTIHVVPAPRDAAREDLPGPAAQPVSDLVVRKHASRREVRRGQPLTYTITITNRGPDTATAVRLVDTPRLPIRVVSIHATHGCRVGRPLTCDLGELRSNAHLTITITAIARATGMQINTASASSDSRDPHPRTAIGSATTRITPPPRAAHHHHRPHRPHRPPPPRVTG